LLYFKKFLAAIKHAFSSKNKMRFSTSSKKPFESLPVSLSESMYNSLSKPAIVPRIAPKLVMFGWVKMKKNINFASFDNELNFSSFQILVSIFLVVPKISFLLAFCLYVFNKLNLFCWCCLSPISIKKL